MNSDIQAFAFSALCSAWENRFLLAESWAWCKAYFGPLVVEDPGWDDAGVHPPEESC